MNYLESVTDAEEEIFKYNIDISGNVDIYTPATYTVTLTIVDSGGLKDSKTLTVTMRPTTQELQYINVQESPGYVFATEEDAYDYGTLVLVLQDNIIYTNYYVISNPYGKGYTVHFESNLGGQEPEISAPEEQETPPLSYIVFQNEKQANDYGNAILRERKEYNFTNYYVSAVSGGFIVTFESNLADQESVVSTTTEASLELDTTEENSEGDGTDESTVEDTTEESSTDESEVSINSSDELISVESATNETVSDSTTTEDEVKD